VSGECACAAAAATWKQQQGKQQQLQQQQQCISWQLASDSVVPAGLSLSPVDCTWCCAGKVGTRKKTTAALPYAHVVIVPRVGDRMGVCHADQWSVLQLLVVGELLQYTLVTSKRYIVAVCHGHGACCSRAHRSVGLSDNQEVSLFMPGATV
jgi:hypothetical protein